MTSDFSSNMELLPIELQHKIYKHFTLEELLTLNRMQLTMFYSISSYIDYYFDKEKYKEQNKLNDCMFLISFIEYKDLIFSYLYELVTDIGVKFYNDVQKAGGPISYAQLSNEENPRDIYTIKIVMIINSNEYEYIITSIANPSNNNLIYYNFGHINRPKNTKFISYNQINFSNEIVDNLLHIIDLLRLDNRKIKSIRYIREKYDNDFIRLKSPILYFDNGYNFFI